MDFKKLELPELEFVALNAEYSSEQIIFIDFDWFYSFFFQRFLAKIDDNRGRAFLGLSKPEQSSKKKLNFFLFFNRIRPS